MSSSHTHPAQELWEKIEWRNEGPNVVPADTNHMSEDAIVAYFPGNVEDRLPPLYKTRGGKILVEKDLSPETSTTVTPTACNNTAVERLEQSLVREVDGSVLPKLVLTAVLEEGLTELITSASTTTTSTTTQGTTSTTTFSSQAHAPPYYSTSPSGYLHPPVILASDDDASVVIGYSPSVLLQRIKSGCILAYNYNSSLVAYQQALNFKESDSSRRSRRLAPPTLPIKPNILIKGGRISTYFIEEYGKEENGGVEETKQEATADENMVEETKQQEQEDATNAGDENMAEEETAASEEQEEEPDDKYKDDDFDPDEESQDSEEEEESFEADEEELDEVEQESSSEEEESDDDEEDDSLTEEDLILSNPHFTPTLDSILDWMGRRGKSLTTAHVQEAIVYLLRNQISIPVTSRFDLMVVDNDSNNVILSNNSNHTPRVVLECTTGDTIKELAKMETSDFAKCRFRWKIVSGASQEELYDENQKLLEQQYYAELKYKKEKAWATWRYKGIQTGHAQWPQWTDAATTWRREQREQQNVGEMESASTAAAAVKEEEASSAFAAASTTATTTENSDLALAYAMEQEDESGAGGRRRTRRGGGDGGVFYGGQMGMSHKQLMDTIVRLAYQQPFQTIMALQSLVAEESSNPMHRIRVALGKLLWKHNQVTRVRVNSVWTDMPLWNVLSKQALLQVPAQLKAEQEVEQEDDPSGKAAAMALPLAKNLPTQENLKHLKVLTEYIRNLHRTELELRSLILHHLTTTPIATVATAADERAGSQEAVDAADFEGDHSSLDWSTSGHALLNQVIFRPSFLLDSHHDTPECTWYKIKDYVPSVPMPPMEDEATRTDGRPREVIGQEPFAVERRMRFRAYPATEEGVDLGEGAILVLTEGQVHAGIMAANLERKKEAAAKSSKEHPFAIGAGTNITLQSQDGAGADKHVQVAGYDTVPGENSAKDGLEHRILLLPQSAEASDSTLAFWAVASMDENGVLACRPVGSSATYKILLSDCDSSSSAFQECEGIIEFLNRQHHSQIFAEPVDPVALKIPTYFSVIKHPMDISTLSANLEKGLYSKIPPGQNVGRSPVARMLNGPFKDDVVRIFDNAMLFNPPDDWIHHTAASMKKAVMKKIDQVSREADDRFRAFSPRKKKSMYVDEDSDMDMYEYESDRDDEDYGRRTTRKRKRVGGKDDFSTQAMEAPVTLRKSLSESLGLRGPFSNLPINSEAAGYSLTSEWNCRHRTASPPEEVKEDAEELKRKQEMEELLMLHHQVEEMERAGLRRSSRAHPVAASNGVVAPASVPNDFEYLLTDGVLPPMGDEETDAFLHKSARSRSEVESHRESLHEVYFAKLYQQLSKFLQPIDRGNGSYVNSSFPPFLGRVVPSLAPGVMEDVTWEIRAPYILPAISWILRGLVHSGHLKEVDTDVLLTNDIYYADDSQQPFDVLDMKEMQRRKRANAASEEESEEEVEMSEYEKLRAERVARNAERLKALGLA